MSWTIDTEKLLNQTKSIAIGESSLADELNKITRFRNIEAPEIIAFYAGRILESMVSFAITKFELPIGDGKLNTILDILSKHGLIDEGTLSIAHAIRRYGNQVRHLDRAIHSNEEATIVGLLQLWVEWFERTIFSKSQNDSESSNGWADKAELLRKLAYPTTGAFDELIQKPEQREVLLAEAAIAEFAAEHAVDFRSEFANEFTASVLKRFPRSVRAKQIRALYLSRNSDPDSAIKILLKLLNIRFRDHDRETFGILGGAFKNKWMQMGNQDELNNAHQYYQKGTEFCPKDYYLRINLAATSLWKGDSNQSRSHANIALQSLAEYGFVINAGDQCDEFDYWILATIAEANLLAGKSKRALYLYEQAKHLDASGGRWHRTSQQLSLHLKYISSQNSVQCFADLLENTATK